MNHALAKQIAALEEMTLAELRKQYAQVFGEETRSTHKLFLRKRIAWGLQARKYGGLSMRARERADELANESALTLLAPKAWTEVRGFQPKREPPRFLPGNVLTREYKGKTISVTVLMKGFEYEGDVYRSLSAIAKAVTGQHWGGLHFFGIAKRGKEG